MPSDCTAINAPNIKSTNHHQLPKSKNFQRGIPRLVVVLCDSRVAVHIFPIKLFSNMYHTTVTQQRIKKIRDDVEKVYVERLTGADQKRIPRVFSITRAAPSVNMIEKISLCD